MPPNRQHPDTLHLLARILVGVREADQARQLGGMFYADLIQRVKDAHQTGRQLLWRPSDTPREGTHDDNSGPLRRNA